LLCLGLSNAQQPTPTPTNRERVAVPQESPKSKEQGNSGGEDEVIKVNSKLVVVPVSVIDANGQPVMNLTVKDFRLEEEDKLQEITEISNAEQVPLEIALLIDVSSSTNSLFEYEKDAAARFLQGVMKSEDRASVFLVSENPILIQPRETSEKTTQNIKAIRPTKNQTAFFDTVLLAVDYLKKNAPQRSRRVIVSLSDGADNWSKLTRDAETNAWRSVDFNALTSKKRNEIAQKTDAAQRTAQDKVLRELQNADTVFYSINPAGSSIKLNKIILRGQDGLQKFAVETGGTAFLPQILANLPNEPSQNAVIAKRNEDVLENIFRQIASELRAQYLLQFYSDTSFPNGKYVRLKAEVLSKPSLRVRARQGYFATTQ
jgi:Ca-activated chloride channel family protein